MASVWEMAIKVSTGKFVLHQPVEPFIAQQLQREDFHLLPIALNHAARVSTMPFHHRDPFDRLIIAQGMVEQMPILSVDAIFDAYGVQRLS